MTSKSTESRDWHEQRVEELRQARIAEGELGKPESPESRETFPHRERKPGDVGLANEARPGLGTRADEDAEKGPPPKPGTRIRREDTSKPRATRYGYEEPRPEPRESTADKLTHEQERSTGVSGHMGNS